MGEEHLTPDAKVRLFDRLMAHQDLLLEAVTRLATEKARALITIHKSGLKPGGRSFTQQDFALDKLAAVAEILNGEPLDIDEMVRAQREALERDLAAAGGTDQPLVCA